MTELMDHDAHDTDADVLGADVLGADVLGAAEEPEADEVVVRRNGWVSAVLAAASAVLAAAYFARAATSFGHTLDWVLFVGLLAMTWLYVFSFLDSRMPLLVADSFGVRIRLGRTWRGMAWGDLDEVEYTPRRHLVRDGRLALFPRDVDGELGLLGPAGRRHARISERLLGAPFALPLGLTARVKGGGKDLCGALVALAAGRCEVVEVVPSAPVEVADDEPVDFERPVGSERVEEPDEPVEAESVALDEHPADPEPSSEPGSEPEPTAPIAVAALVASPTPGPLRDVRPAVRAEVASDRDWVGQDTAAEVPAIPAADSTFVIDDLAAMETVDPVIGPELKAARERLRLSVDQLADRTRIRPHVIEAIEIDDFAPCGGDFYARGHLRTLARVLGVDVTPLLATYDDTYADAPIDPRRVFEAELATGRHGPIRGGKGGPNWSVIVAAVMTVVLAWSVARLVMDDPHPVSSPSLSEGSAGLTSGSTKVASPVPVVLTAAGGGAHVVVRDGAGKVVFTGSLAFGQTKTMSVSPPVRVQTTDGSLTVTIDGQPHGPIGRTGQAAQDVYTVR